MGIEPTPSAWKAEVLPLNYTRRAFTPNHGACRAIVADPSSGALTGNPRASARHYLRPGAPLAHPACRGGPQGLRKRHSIWWRGEDSNLRRLSRQIYSLIPLTAREPLRKERRSICNRWAGVKQHQGGIDGLGRGDAEANALPTAIQEERAGRADGRLPSAHGFSPHCTPRTRRIGVAPPRRRSRYPSSACLVPTRGTHPAFRKTHVRSVYNSRVGCIACARFDRTSRNRPAAPPLWT